ncbi:hypothetical protein [Nocardioides marmorisolisilvae]|uniref:Transmembrane protein n=1 Tax=Nocardioides marmorisolisilvae TaxID=1542737 RepID=A0A3N0E0J3_9ACTN|nr:hypothetical protein [Nocardioides marmorisolisilvae]RNL81374.1 hypothetical protein EFL95_03240 [Nocardioides marmorisolisilvae]
MTSPSKPAGLFAGMLGLWVFLVLTAPVIYFFGGSVLPRYQCDQECTVNDSAGLLTSLAFLVLVTALAFGLPLLAQTRSQRRDTTRTPQHRPIVLRRIHEPARPTGSPNVFVRVLLYGLLAVAGGFVAMVVGEGHFEATVCGGPDFQGECDTGFTEGFLWSTAWIVVVLIGGFCIELQLIVNGILRRRGRLST